MAKVGGVKYVEVIDKASKTYLKPTRKENPRSVGVFLASGSDVDIKRSKYESCGCL